MRLVECHPTCPPALMIAANTSLVTLFAGGSMLWYRQLKCEGTLFDLLDTATTRSEKAVALTVPSMRRPNCKAWAGAVGWIQF